MRVIGGEFRSRLLKTLPGPDVRPTPDRLRETLFNILAPRIGDATFLDVYAGTGAVGIEALSRGAARATFIERTRTAANIIRENLRTLRLESKAEVLHGRALQYLPHRRADIVFIDPPYSLDAEYSGALEVLGAEPPALVVVQHDKRRKLEDGYGELRSYRSVVQGDNVLTFFRRIEAAPE